jgi:hypothetical protein
MRNKASLRRGLFFFTFYECSDARKSRAAACQAVETVERAEQRRVPSLGHYRVASDLAGPRT